MPLLIVNEENDKSFSLSRQECLELELVFNKSGKGKEWRELGDELYKSYINKGNESVVLNNTKYTYLFKLSENCG